MELYLRWLEKYEMKPGEERPVGLILCAEKSREQVELLMLDEDQIKVAEYLTKISSSEVFAEKLHLAVEMARRELEDGD